MSTGPTARVPVRGDASRHPDRPGRDGSLPVEGAARVPTAPGAAGAQGSGVRSLADDLRGRSDADLAALLQVRPDLGRPTPSDLTALAARSTTRASTTRAIDALDQGMLDVLTASAALDGPLEAEAVAAALGVGAHATTTVAAALDRLWTLALIWGESPRHVSRTVLDALGPWIAGLGPAARTIGLADPTATLATTLTDLPPGARVVLDSLAWGPPVATLTPGSRAREAVVHLSEAGLGSLEDDSFTLPREVALALRGGVMVRDAALHPPALTGTSWDEGVVDRSAAGSATEILAQVDDLLATWSTDPPRVLKSGGLAARDLTSAARSLEVTPQRVALLLEVALSAGLVAQDGEEEGHWTPTVGYDEWLDQPGGTRWAGLALAWWDMTRDPSLVGTHRDGRLVAALSSSVHRPALRSLRHEIIGILAALPPGLAPSPSDLAERVRWQRPRRLPTNLDEVLAAVLDEAATLGVLALGAASTPGRVLAALGSHGAGGDRVSALAGEMQTHLPAPVSHVVLQGDLTAVVPGPTSGSLTHFLRLAADLESRGGATVHRFSEASIRRCLDAGWSADEILAALTDASSTPVPQPLDYLVRDSARRHGRLRVSPARTVVRVDDPSALDTLIADRATGALQLRRVAPTVAVSVVDPDVVVGLLRDAGHPAVTESQTGAITIRERKVRRSTADLAPSSLVRRLDDEAAADIVSDLRAADRAQTLALGSRRPPLVPTGDPTTSLAVLREACADGRAVWIGYSDGAGAVRRFLFHPESVDHGRVHGIADGVRRTISIHRVTGVGSE